VSIFSGIKKMFGLNSNFVRDEDEQEVYDVDSDGKQLFREDIISTVLEKLDKRKNERSPLERQWILNANFMLGNQFCDINPYSGNDIQQVEPVYDWLEREPFNRISPLIETRIANLKKIKYLMTVKPATNELDDYAKADVSTAILRNMQSSTNFETHTNTMIAWNELCGNCFWLSWWNKDGGEKYVTEKVAVLGSDGIEEIKEVAYYEGDLDYGLLTPYEIYPESIFKQGIEAQRSIIIEQVKSIDDIYDLYGLKVDGANVDTFQLTPIGNGSGFGHESTVMSMGHRTVDDAEKVITYFEKPSKHCPNGKMIIIIGNEHLVYYGDLPYEQIPIVQVVCKETAGQFFGRSVIEELIPLQRAYNGCINRIHEYIKRIAIQSYIVEEGSIDTDDYEENGVAPGEMLIYKQGSKPPVPAQNGRLPSEVMAERHNLIRDMEYTAGVSQLMVTGAMPSGVTSGTAIENLRDIDNTRLSLTGDHIRGSVKTLAKIWLKIYKRYANTRRAINYVGTNNIAAAITWSNKDISGYDIEYTTENELILSEEIQKQRFFEAYNLGFFTDASGRIPERVKYKAREYMKIGNYADLMSIDTLQMQAAQRENVFFESGVVPAVLEIDNHEIHIDEHMRYVLQMQFQILKMKKPELAQLLEQHISQHKKIVQESEQQKLLQIQQMNGGK
jgi:hypothetical protein